MAITIAQCFAAFHIAWAPVGERNSPKVVSLHSASVGGRAGGTSFFSKGFGRKSWTEDAAAAWRAACGLGVRPQSSSGGVLPQAGGAERSVRAGPGKPIIEPGSESIPRVNPAKSKRHAEAKHLKGLPVSAPAGELGPFKESPMPAHAAEEVFLQRPGVPGRGLGPMGPAQGFIDPRRERVFRQLKRVVRGIASIERGQQVQQIAADFLRIDVAG